MVATLERDDLKAKALQVIVLRVLNTMSRVIWPRGWTSMPGMMLLNIVTVVLMWDSVISIFFSVSTYRRLRLLSPSIRTLVRWQPSIIRSRTTFKIGHILWPRFLCFLDLSACQKCEKFDIMLLSFNNLLSILNVKSRRYRSNCRMSLSISSTRFNMRAMMKMIRYERHCFSKNISNYGVMIRNFSSPFLQTMKISKEWFFLMHNILI